MHIFERCSKAIRHSYFLEQACWLWDHIRPLYEKILPLLSGNHGIERIINGTDRIFVTVQFRSLSEVREPQAWKYLMGQVRPGDIAADIGAYLGLYTVALAKRVGPFGKVFSFEPDPQNFIFLKQLIEMNQVAAQVEIFNMAVGSQDGEVKFSAGLDCGSHISYTLSLTKDVTTVRCICLDTLFTNKRLDILKIDVEGFEEAVLQGANNLLRDRIRSPRAILIELHPFAWPNIGTSSKSILQRLSGYTHTIFDKNGVAVTDVDSSWHCWLIAQKDM